MKNNNSFNPIETISSIIETHFSIERKAHPRQKFIEQINDELVLIINKAIDLSDNPVYTLLQLGIIIFPGSIAFRKNIVAKLLALCKSSFESRLTKAGWSSSNIYCISTVQRCLRRIVRTDYKNWTLKSIPKGSSFDLFVNNYPAVFSGKNEIMTEEEFFSSIYTSEVSSPLPSEY
ncbi:hypothetical protein M9Y10_029591 [Tritrichomonas musculus]|uniref:Initiator binding domain-containing protein n=1 Tax=Tritrichomonas musculus TaxID=1915356 RepID=A0ABR2KMJ7_9EUKA